MVNVVNVFWALPALISGALFTYALWAFVFPAMALFTSPGTLMYLMVTIGMFTFAVFWTFVVPILTILDEEEGGIAKKLMTGKL